MHVPVLIESVSTGYRAIGPFQMVGEGPTADAAMEQLSLKLADLHKVGARVVMLDVPISAQNWLFRSETRTPEEEKVWQEWKEIMARQRQSDAEHEADI